MNPQYKPSVSIETPPASLALVLQIFYFFFNPVKIHSSHENSGIVTSPTQQLQIAGIGSPKAPPPSAAQNPPAANPLANRGGGLINVALAQ